jgi:hypothetical protein
LNKVYSINEIYSKHEMHLEKLLLIGSTECVLAKFRSSWIGSNNFSFKEAHPQNAIIDSNVGVISTEKLFEIEPTYNYVDDLASRDAQPLAEVGTWSIYDPMVVQPVEVSKPVEQSPKIEPTHHYDDDLASKDVQPMVEVNPWTFNGPRVGQPVEQWPNIDPTLNNDDFPIKVKDVKPIIEIKPIKDEFGQGRSAVASMSVHDFESPRRGLHGRPHHPWTPRSTPPPVFPCEHNEYEISIAMGSDLWSGTDDKVEIRLYFLDGSISKWFDLRIPMYNAFERLSIDSFCVQPQEGTLQKPSYIGLRKFGRDQMKIEAVMVSTMISSSAFNVGQWIRTNDEYVFQSSEDDI